MTKYTVYNARMKMIELKYATERMNSDYYFFFIIESDTQFVIVGHYNTLFNVINLKRLCNDCVDCNCK